MIVKPLQFSTRSLLGATAIVAVFLGGGVAIMPAADRYDLGIIWVGPVFLVLCALGALVAAVAAVRFGAIILAVFASCWSLVHRLGARGRSGAG